MASLGSIGNLSDLLHETGRSQTSKMRTIANLTEACHGLKRLTLVSSLEKVHS
jgi:uncharacterized pyridoxal phosphate-containing UPF0001 family protein